MYSLEANGYSDAEMREILKKDRTVWYEFDLLDKDEMPLGKITATGSIDYNSEVAIQRVASLNIVEERDIDFLSERVRPSMCVETPNGVARFPLGVFLMSSPSRRASSGTIGREIDCYDKCQILADDKFTSRYLIAANTTYMSAIADIITSAGITDARITPSAKETAAALEFNMGTSKLEAVNQLLQAINYNNIYADASGKLIAAPYLDPITRDVNCSYVTDSKSITLPNAEEELDVFNAPNKIVRYLETADRGVLISEYTNTDPYSKLSTVSRGRTIVDIASVNDIADQATLDAYTVRVATEKKIYQKVIFRSAVMPNHESNDCIYVINKDLDVAGKYVETAWNIEMRNGGTMSHSCRKAVSI